MKHQVKNTKFHSGVDSNQMIVRKLMKNFLRRSTVVTTHLKGKVLKMNIDRIVSKSRTFTQSNKNVLLKYFPEPEYIKVLFEQVGPAVKDIAGGYVRIIKLGIRENDGASMVRVEWAHPVVIDWEPKSKEKSKPTVKPKAKTKAKPEVKKDAKTVKKAEVNKLKAKKVVKA